MEKELENHATQNHELFYCICPIRECCKQFAIVEGTREHLEQIHGPLSNTYPYFLPEQYRRLDRTALRIKRNLHTNVWKSKNPTVEG